MTHFHTLCAPLALALSASPLAAQDAHAPAEGGSAANLPEAAAGVPDRPPRPESRSVLAGDWIAVGAGFVYGANYSGSNDYRLLAVPVVAANFRGIGIRPRAAGLSINLLEGMRGDVTFSAGPTFRIRSDRSGSFKDDVVKAAGKLDTAIELGGQVGISFNRIATRFDRLSFDLDVQHDVAGAHGGMLIDPGVSYSLALGRGAVVSLGASAQHVDGDFADYYYSVTPGQSAASGLPVFDADGGWHKAGVTLAMGFDASGDFRDGGLIFGGALGYRRLLGDAADTPFTALRGDADQFTAIFGAAYVF
ncbi:MAG TPA: MipA/OmpV family protein [Erythrobacter sp.]|nr:MipA/OmpV family protein [Erythrobacter sp.]